ncbi:cytochrome P450 [Streptomyces sp. NPDC059255]|uniref:cytochrome P450 family protein n=1 Tax=Streptomyces sp. NPDC059255 TaxID=3346793 RepID=UPI0036A055E3
MPDPRPPVLLDESFQADPHASYAALRGTTATLRALAPDGAPVWLVTSYHDVRASAADPRLSLNKAHAKTAGRHGDSMPPELDAHLLNTDPPTHTRLRRLVNSAFTGQRTEQFRQSTQTVTDQLLDRLAARGGHADIVADLAIPLSLTVISNLLGIPEHDRPDFRSWTDTLHSPAPDAAVRSREAMREMHHFLAELIERKRDAPGDDLLSALIDEHTHPDGPCLSRAELVSMAFLLLFGGYHNSAGLISTTVLALLSHPVHLAALRSGELTMDQVTEEALRWNSPAMLAVRRFATQDIRIGEAAICEGERVWLAWASANRDPDRFVTPETFDPTRDTRGHLAFGHGPHYCPGASLARLENEIAVTSLVRRFPELSLVGPVSELRWTTSLRNRSLRELPVSMERGRTRTLPTRSTPRRRPARTKPVP